MTTSATFTVVGFLQDVALTALSFAWQRCRRVGCGRSDLGSAEHAGNVALWWWCCCLKAEHLHPLLPQSLTSPMLPVMDELLLSTSPFLWNEWFYSILPVNYPWLLSSTWLICAGPKSRLNRAGNSRKQMWCISYVIPGIRWDEGAMLSWFLPRREAEYCRRDFPFIFNEDNAGFACALWLWWGKVKQRWRKGYCCCLGEIQMKIGFLKLQIK